MAFHRFATALLLTSVAVLTTAGAQCPEEPRLDNFVGAGRVVCPCFIENEHAGAIFDLPASEFPIEILRVGIGWGSQFGGNPQQIEDSINIYEGGLPNPGSPIFSLGGPQLTDGAINEFDIEPIAGNKIINSGPFTVTLRFLNDSTVLGPSVVHDGNGCQLGKNIVFAIPGGWVDGCTLGITGQWVFYVVYRKASCGPSGGGSVPDNDLVPGTPMVAELVAGNDIMLTWSSSCQGSDDDYGVYEGTIGSYYSHFSKLCTTGGMTTVTFTPGNGDRYYLVVPSSPAGEGSYGRDGTGAERPTGGGACQPQQPIACP